jgi:hypothetical protein
MQYYLFILSIPFFYINYKIILSDVKYKKIPNFFLGVLMVLVPIYYIYAFIFFDINIISFIIQIFFTIFVSFVLYYIWIWSAWDAKYLLVLGLFIPNIWIIPFVWNIAFLTIIYLFFYFLYFYFWRCIFVKWYAKSLLKNIYTDLKDSFWIFLEKYDNNNTQTKTFYKILKWFLVFLLLFVGVRFARLYVFQHLLNTNNNWFHSWIFWYFFELLKNHSEYLVLTVVSGFLLWIFLLGKIFTFLREFIVKYLKIKRQFLSIVFFIVLIFW